MYCIIDLAYDDVDGGTDIFSTVWLKASDLKELTKELRRVVKEDLLDTKDEDECIDGYEIQWDTERMETMNAFEVKYCEDLRYNYASKSGRIIHIFETEEEIKDYLFHQARA